MLTIGNVSFARDGSPQLTVTFPYSFGEDAMRARAIDVALAPIVSALMRADGDGASEWREYENGITLAVSRNEFDPLRFHVRTV